MHKVLLLSISLVFISFSVLAEHEESTNTDCATLGYKTDTLKCLEEKGRPLVCPYSGSNASKCICIKESCRGYDITAEDKKQKTASDGRSIDAHILSYEECTIGSGEEELTLYRVKECAEGSLYQNGLCDVGCDTINKYPYLLHPGNLAGEVEICKDALGEYFGYKECNDGWSLSNGRCVLNKCNVVEYPYLSDPNVKENRGQTLTCRVGGNLYYKYTDVDKEGKTLTSDSCKINGHTLNGGVCSKRCEISECEATSELVKDENDNEYFSYNKWRCKKETDNCVFGDYVYIDGVYAGIVAHIPDDNDERMHVLSLKGVAGNMAINEAVVVSPPLLQSFPNEKMITDMNGKYNSKAILAYQSLMNSELFKYPLYTSVNNFAPSDCSGACGKGEWYINAGGELFYLYNERYKLRSITANDVWVKDEVYSSTEYSKTYNGLVSVIAFSGMGGRGYLFDEGGRGDYIITYPMISFTLK